MIADDETLWPQNCGNSLEFEGYSQTGVPDLEMTQEIGCAKVKEMGFLEASALECASSTPFKSRSALISKSWPWDGTFVVSGSKWSQ